MTFVLENAIQLSSEAMSANVWAEKRGVRAYYEVLEVREILKAETFLKAVVW